MISYQEALQTIKTLPQTSRRERCFVSKALNRILAEDVSASMPHPFWSNSAMDGFAYSHKDVDGDSIGVVGTQYAGRLHVIPKPSAKNVCVKVMTGSPLPDWVDTVVPIEHVSVKDGGISFIQRPKAGKNVRLKASDIAEGETLISRGTLLTPERLMVLAGLGVAEVDVVQQPGVAVLGTGDELLDPGEKMAPGMVYNSSRIFLEAALAQAGIQSCTARRVQDNPSALIEAIEQITSDDDGELRIILTTGAVSQGDKDYIPSVAHDLGFKTLFHKVWVRPGKPVFLAQKANRVWLGIPGNPISTVTTWHFFARQILEQCALIPQQTRMKRPLRHDVAKPKEFRCFYRGFFDGSGVLALEDQGSGNFKSMQQANCIMELPENLDLIPKGTEVETINVGVL